MRPEIRLKPSLPWKPLPRMGGLLVALFCMGCPETPEEEEDVSPPPFDGGDDFIKASPILRCDNPVDGIDRFSEESQERGLTTPLLPVNINDAGEVPGVGGDVVAVDLDADGDVDILAGGMEGTPIAYRNDGTGHFEEILPPPVQMPVSPRMPPYIMAYGTADLNGDLLPEVIFGGSGWVGVFVNQGNLSFEFESVVTFGNQFDPPHNSTHSVGDADNDGDLDIFVPTNGVSSDGHDPDAAKGSPDVLLIQSASESFAVEVELVAGEEGSRSQAAVFTDRDLDGDLDLLTLSDKGPPSNFFRNDGIDGDGQLVLIDDAPELSANLEMAAMGIDSADLNGDGLLDYCMSDVGLPKCLLSDGAGGYYEAHAAMGLSVNVSATEWKTIGWSVDLADLDNDQRVELVQASGPHIESFKLGEEIPDVLWQQNSDGTFTDVSAESGINSAANHIGLATADFDGNGYLDVLLAGPGKTLDLHMNECGSNGWLQVELIGPEGNSEGFGAQVVVDFGEKRFTREIQSLRSHGQSPSMAHFGAGEEAMADRIEVHWPDGHVSVAKHARVNRVYSAKHPDAVDARFGKDIVPKGFGTVQAP